MNTTSSLNPIDQLVLDIIAAELTATEMTDAEAMESDLLYETNTYNFYPMDNWTAAESPNATTHEEHVEQEEQDISSRFPDIIGCGDFTFNAEDIVFTQEDMDAMIARSYTTPTPQQASDLATDEWPSVQAVSEVDEAYRGIVAAMKIYCDTIIQSYLVVAGSSIVQQELERLAQLPAQFGLQMVSPSVLPPKRNHHKVVVQSAIPCMTRQRATKKKQPQRKQSRATKVTKKDYANFAQSHMICSKTE